MAALGELLGRGAQAREVYARARAAAEDDALAPDPVEDRVHRVVDREDEAGRALRLLLEADVEPDRAVEGGELVDEDRLELGLEGGGLLLVGEVAAVVPPLDDRVDDAADHLAHARLALGRGHAAAEVLLRDDVRRRLRPELRELDALLLEDGLVLAGDEGVPDLPLDLVEGIPSWDGEIAAHAEAPIGRCNRVHERFVGNCGSFIGACRRHVSSSIVSVASPRKTRGPKGSAVPGRCRFAGLFRRAEPRTARGRAGSPPDACDRA